MNRPNYQKQLQEMYPDGSVQGECAAFAERLMWFGPVGDTLTSKAAYAGANGLLPGMLPAGPEIGDVVITSESQASGHVCFVNGKDGTTLTLTESNYHLDGRVHHDRQIQTDNAKIVGVIRKPLLFPVGPAPERRTIRLTVVSKTPAPIAGQLEETRAAVEKYSAGALTIGWTVVSGPIGPVQNDLTQEDAYKLVDSIGLHERFVVIFYESSTAAYLNTFSYPAGRCDISCVPDVQPGRSIAFEIAHGLAKAYMDNRPAGYPQIEDTDSSYPSDDFIAAKFLAITPYLDIVLGPVDSGNNDMGQLATADGKRVWLILGGFRMWVLDPETLRNGTGKLWQAGVKPVTAAELAQHAYGGTVFVSDTDDPIK